eukprot:359247-Chlamydomonas_euryale.AAC.3
MHDTSGRSSTHALRGGGQRPPFEPRAPKLAAARPIFHCTAVFSGACAALVRRRVVARAHGRFHPLCGEVGPACRAGWRPCRAGLASGGAATPPPPPSLPQPITRRSARCLRDACRASLTRS